jgi:hypothetical protein
LQGASAGRDFHPGPHQQEKHDVARSSHLAAGILPREAALFKLDLNCGFQNKFE